MAVGPADVIRQKARSIRKGGPEEHGGAAKTGKCHFSCGMKTSGESKGSLAQDHKVKEEE